MAKRIMTPPLNDEAMEGKLISLAQQQAQSQLEAGTASSQIVTHFLRLGSQRAEVELEQLRLQNQLLEEKILAEQSGQLLSDMMTEVLSALRSYTPNMSGPGDGDRDVDVY